MSRVSDVKTAFEHKECSTCEYCYMKGFNFYCSKKSDKRISAMAIEDCYVPDLKMKQRLLYFSKNQDQKGEENA